MNTTPGKSQTRRKRPSKGMARHNRLVKQEARRNSIPGSIVKKGKRPAGK